MPVTQKGENKQVIESARHLRIAPILKRGYPLLPEEVCSLPHVRHGCADEEIILLVGGRVGHLDIPIEKGTKVKDI